MFEVISLVVLVKSFVEFPEDVGNSFSKCDAFSFVVLYFVMNTLFFAVLIPVFFRTPLNSSRILWMSCCLFIFSLMHFFMRLLRSFSLCFSSLGVLLLSSMSLRISASLSRNYSLPFAAADVVTRTSLIEAAS